MNLVGFLTSRGLAVFLLAVSVALMVAWTRYPGFYTPYLLVVPAFVLISLLACTIKRMTLAGKKAGVRFWGSIVFHLGMILGVAIIFLAPLFRYSSRIAPLEGTTVVFNDMDSVTLIDRPVFGTSTPNISVKLTGYEVKHQDGVFPVDYSAFVTVGFLEGDEYRRTDSVVRINGPLTLNGYQFLLESGGYTPMFILRDNAEREVFNNYVRLANVPRIEDSFEMERVGLIVYTRFFPDMFRDGHNGGVGTRSMELKNPAFGIKILRKDTRQEVFSGVLKVGESALFEGFTLEFKELRPFAVLVVVKDPLYWLLFVAWAIGLAGLVVRYLPMKFF